MKNRSIFALILSVALLPSFVFAETESQSSTPETVRTPRGGRRPNPMVEQGEIDPTPEPDRGGMGGSYDGTDDPTLFRNSVAMKSWATAANLWHNLSATQKQMAVDQTVQKLIVGSAIVGGTLYVISRPVRAIAVRAAALSIFLAPVVALFEMTSPAGAEETIEFQRGVEGVNRFYSSYGNSVRAMNLHSVNQAAVVEFHKELTAQMIAVQNTK